MKIVLRILASLLSFRCMASSDGEKVKKCYDNRDCVIAVHQAMCFNQSRVVEIQAKNLYEIRKVILPNSVKNDVTYENFLKDSYSYYTWPYARRYFNITKLRNLLPHQSSLHRASGGKDGIVFYEIYKNANTNLRYYFCNYAHYITKNFSHMCTSDIFLDYYVCNIDRLTPWISIDHHRRVSHDHSALIDFNFAITRNPLDRFLSAYTEIEYRKEWELYISHHINGTHMVETKIIEPKAAFGRIERFQEFIKILVRDIAPVARHLGSSYHHASPVIGTLQEAYAADLRIPNLYRLEHFDAEMKRFAAESGLTGFDSSYRICKNRDFAAHASSSDPE